MSSGLRSATPSSRGSEKGERDLLPWALWQRLIMVGTAFFVSIFMSGITVAHLGMLAGERAWVTEHFLFWM